MASEPESGKTPKPSWRARRRRLAMGLATVLGGTPRGFFIPYRYAADMPDRAERTGYPALGERFAAAEGAFAAHLQAIDGYAPDLEAIGAEAPPQPRWKQEWFPRLDAAAAYATVREAKPRRLVEVGSGHSTRFYFRAVKDGGLATRITAIDPAPRADVAALDIELFQATVQRAGLKPFADLAAGDILSIDSSHILMPGSDVDLLFNEVLPHLPAGVHVHIHDIFLPWEYPESLVHGSRFFWTEQYLLQALLAENARFEVLFAAYFMARKHPELLREIFPEFDSTPNLKSSFWIRRVGKSV